MKRISLLLILTLVLSGCFDNKTKKIENCADSYWARDNHFYKEHPDRVKDWERKSLGWNGGKSFKKKRDEKNFKTYEDQYRNIFFLEQEFLKKDLSEKLKIIDYEKWYFKACEKDREEAPITFDEKWKSFKPEMSEY